MAVAVAVACLPTAFSLRPASLSARPRTRARVRVRVRVSSAGISSPRVVACQQAPAPATAFSSLYRARPLSFSAPLLSARVIDSVSREKGLDRSPVVFVTKAVDRNLGLLHGRGKLTQSLKAFAAAGIARLVMECWGIVEQNKPKADNLVRNCPFLKKVGVVTVGHDKIDDWYDVPVFGGGRSPLEIYSDFGRTFKHSFNHVIGSVMAIEIGMAELRFVSGQYAVIRRRTRPNAIPRNQEGNSISAADTDDDDDDGGDDDVRGDILDLLRTRTVEHECILLEKKAQALSAKLKRKKALTIGFMILFRFVGLIFGICIIFETGILSGTNIPLSIILAAVSLKDGKKAIEKPLMAQLEVTTKEQIKKVIEWILGEILSKV